MKSTTNSRFAFAGRDGRLVALVADGAIEWPVPDDVAPADATSEHFGSLEDTQIAELEQQLLAEFDRIAADTSGDTDALQQRETELAGIGDRVRAVQAEAARRYEAAAAGNEPGNEPADPPPANEPGNEPAADADRDARIAALRAGLSGDTEPAEPAVLESVEGLSRQEIAQLVADGAREAASAAATAVVTALAESRTEPHTGRPVSAADLAQFGSQQHIPATPVVHTSPRFPARLQSAADIPNLNMGTEITELSQLVKAMIDRHRALGKSTGTEDEKVPVASLSVEVPTERDLRDSDWAQARAKVQSLIGPNAVGVDPWTGKEALIAAGGISAPRQPYYGQLVIAQSARPVRDALPTFAADRGGIQLVLPPSIATLSAATQPGTFSDGVSNTDTSWVSAGAAFNAADVGKPITGTNIPTGTLINSVTNATTVVLSQATTGTGTGRSFTLPARNPNNLGNAVGLQSLAQDEANGVKYTYDVPHGTPATFDVYAVYTSLQFGNIGARTFPEAVEANIRIADALHARVAETQMLDVITAWSTLMTGAKTFGTARQLLAQLGRMAAWYRNSERMDPNAVLRVGLPAFSAQAMSADWLSTFIGSDLATAAGALSDDEISSILQKYRLVPFWYQDGPSDISQLFSTVGIAGATNTGTNSATPIPIPDYPGAGATTSFRNKIVSFMWAEGSWLGLTTGDLNLGLVRDSILNSQNRFRNFMEEWETPAFVGTRSLRCVHTVASDGTYGSAVSVTLGAGSGL